jgi:hypothetical protein
VVERKSDSEVINSSDSEGARRGDDEVVTVRLRLQKGKASEVRIAWYLAMATVRSIANVENGLIFYDT